MHILKIHFKVINAAIFVCLWTVGCNAPKLSVADEQMARGEYYEAARTYGQIYKRLTKKQDKALRGEVAFKMGEAYGMLRQNARAASSYGNALRFGYSDSICLYKMARMLHASGRYADAVTAYEQYLERYPSAPMARNGLAGVVKAMEEKHPSTRYRVGKSKLFNTARSEFAPMLNGDALYFTTTAETVAGNARSEITGMKRSDIWVSRKDEAGNWQRPQPLEGEINTDMDEGVVSFSPDGSTMYVSMAKREPDAPMLVAIYKSRRSDARWSAPVKLEIDGDSVYSYGHPSVSPDGTYLYFTGDRPGYGGKDIWRINLKNGSTMPENLGPLINTAGDEMFPFARTDSLLYFASDGHIGYGGLDLFKAQLMPSGGWAVMNMGTPVNSSADDFGITFYDNGEAGYFSSGRGDIRGYDNIYHFELPDVKVTINGVVADADDEPISKALVRIVGDDGSNRKAMTRNDGTFDFPLQLGVSYVMLAGGEGYLNARQSFATDTIEEDADYRVDFKLVSLTKPNVVENIFYDYNKAVLRPESKESLDELVQMMNMHPNITIEMSAHTDRVGSDRYNEALSERRAKAVVDYLIDSGVDSGRMTYKGYGKSVPKCVTKRIAKLYPQFPEGTVLTEDYVLSLDDVDREIADQINRRTEFMVLSTDYGIY